MPSVAQLASLLLLVAQSEASWAHGPPSAPYERLDPRAVFTRAGDVGLSRDQRPAQQGFSGQREDGRSPPEPPEKIARDGGRTAASSNGGLPGDAIHRGPTPLAPPSAEKKNGSEGARLLAPPLSLLKVAGGLGAVLGLFLIVAWAMRRVTPANPPLLPSEVLEVLGRAPLAGRQQVHLIRLGRKLVLVSVTPAGIETLSEVAEPEEVDRLAGICRQAMSGSATAAFREVLQQVLGKAGGRAV